MPNKDKSYQKRFDGKRKIAVLQIFSDLKYHFKTAGVRTSTFISIPCALAIFICYQCGLVGHIVFLSLLMGRQAGGRCSGPLFAITSITDC